MGEVNIGTMAGVHKRGSIGLHTEILRVHYSISPLSTRKKLEESSKPTPSCRSR